MIKEVFKIDENGFIVYKMLVEFDEQGNCLEELASNIITVAPPSFYKSRWDGTKWVETMTEVEYIATLPKPPQQEPTTAEQLMLAMADLDAQRVKDKLETQLAIAELTNTILGGK